MSEERDTERDTVEQHLRPKTLADYIGQQEIKQQMSIFIKAAIQRNESLDHLLVFGPPGLGKTTLAHIVATELNVTLRQTSGPVIEKAADLAALLTNLKDNDVLFIDEIHRLSPSIEEILYPAMEDCHIDLMIGEGPAAKSVKIDLPPFTLVGATTRAGLLSSPLRDRFGIVQRIDFYSPKELQKIIHRSSSIIGIDITSKASELIADSSRGTPRIANRLLRRVRDVAQVRGEKNINEATTQEALAMLKVDKLGLDELDQRYLRVLADTFKGGPVGIDAISATLGEDSGTIEDVVEPFLLKRELIVRSQRGRAITKLAYQLLGITPNKSNSDLFN